MDAVFSSTSTSTAHAEYEYEYEYEKPGDSPDWDSETLEKCIFKTITMRYTE
jgi:hypothetical protein